MHTKVAIIGSGPAGLTSAIYASRALLEPVLVGGRAFGGQLMNTTEVDNFPGFPDGILGPELMQQMRAQAERFGTVIIEENVVSLNTESRPFTIESESQTVTADTVILAMGASHKELGIASEEKFKGKGVSYCATCDGFFFRNKPIAVIGGGDTAMEEALFLTRFGSKVYVVHRRDSLRASKVMQEKAFSNEKIEFVWNSEVEEIIGDASVGGLRLKDTVSGETKDLEVAGVFVAIGLVPNSEIIKGHVDTDERGYIMMPQQYHASVPGIFVAGDVHDHKYRQAITAAGMGCAAALEAERYLASQEEK